ncbi:MAG: TetR/AcrR family transcriptional regulator, partial [Dehalococcoidia bacterium]
MSPRAYNLGLRVAAAEQTRARIIAAAREILSDEAFDGLSIDAIARRAGVARMTVYYQFTSRRGLLEALFEDIGDRGLGPYLRDVDAYDDPAEGLAHLCKVLMCFYTRERTVIRRLRSLAVNDAEVEASLRHRDALRAAHVCSLLQRIEDAGRWRAPISVAEAAPAVAALVGFQYFDEVAPEHGDPQVT